MADIRDENAEAPWRVTLEKGTDKTTRTDDWFYDAIARAWRDAGEDNWNDDFPGVCCEHLVNLVINMEPIAKKWESLKSGTKLHEACLGLFEAARRLKDEIENRTE